MDKDEILATIETPQIPSKGRVGFQEAMGIQQPYLQKKAELLPKIREAEGDVAKAKQAQAETLATGKLEATQKQAGDVKRAMTGYQEKLEAEPLPAFVPTQDTVQDIAGLFSLIGVLGMVAGKSNAMQAMNAMNGMLEGHRKGRKDLYQQERQTFEKNFQSMLKKHEEFRKEMEDAVKLAATDRDAGMQAAELAAVKAGSSIAQAELRQGRLMDVFKLVDEVKQGAKFAFEQEGKERERESRERKEAQRHAELMAGKGQVFQGSDKKMYSYDPYSKKITEIDTGGVTLTKPGGRGTTAGQNALTFASRVYSNIENAAQDLKNIVAMPATASLPIFSGLLNTERDSALKSMESLISRKITKDENRAFQQVSDQLGSALARLESQGLATGSTKANIAAFNSLRPAAGDSAINMALYIARVKQEIETGIRVHNKMPGATEEQKETTKEILNSLDTFVPFDTDDVLRVLRKNKAPLGDKMSRLIQQPAIAPDLNTSGSAAPAAAPTATPAPQTAGPKEGDTSTSKSGKPIVFRNGSWEYQ